MKITEVIFESIKKNVMEDFDKEANAYKAHLIKTLPQIIGLFANTGKGWMPSEEQMLAAVETGYQIMKRTGSVKQAGAAVGNEINALYKASQKGVAESTLQEIYKMPPTRNSSQGLAVWAYNDALEEKSPIFYKNNNVIIYKASEELLRYIILQDEKPVLYIGFRKFLDGYQSGVVGTEMTGRGKGLAQKAYLNASDILDVPIYSDTTQTDASRLGIWNKLIQQYPNRVVGYDQKSGRDLPLQITDQGPVINQNQPIYVKSSKNHKYIALNDRSRTRLLKLLPNTQQSVAESTKGVTPTGYTWTFEKGSEVPYKSNVEANTFIRVRDSKGKTVLGVWADVYRDDVEIQYSEVFDKKLRGKGIYTDFLKGLAKHYNIISDKDHNNAARNIYKKLGADYNPRSEKHTLRRSSQSVAKGLNEFLSSMVDQDQAERNEYANFVKSQAGGDWSKGAKMYAQFKKRPSNDIFGDATRLNQFMKMKFDFDKFTDEDWDNYWLLAQHCDNNRDFQKSALSIIKKYQGKDHSHYKYLYDRISMGLTGKQKYGTQNIKEQDVAEDKSTKKISFKLTKGKNKFSTTMLIDGVEAGIYQYDANSARSIAEVYPEFKGKGFGKILFLNAIYTAAKLGMDFLEDESRTAEADHVLDSLSDNGYIINDDGYLYVTGGGEKYLKQSLSLDEMALKQYEPLGQFEKPGPFKDPDYKLVTHPVHIQKVGKFFERTPYDFRIFVSNLPKLRKYRESGEKTPEQIREIFGKDADKILAGSEDSITIIFLGNYGDARVMLTPWIMAHRLGHSVQSTRRQTQQRLGDDSGAWKQTENYFFSTMNTILRNYYNKGAKSERGLYYSNVDWGMAPEYNALFNAIGTQRSSRSGEIKRPYEFLYELFAQYLKDGTVSLNPIPVSLAYGRKAWGKPTKWMSIQQPELRSEEGRKALTEKITKQLNSLFAAVLEESVGKIFVM